MPVSAAHLRRWSARSKPRADLASSHGISADLSLIRGTVAKPFTWTATTDQILAKVAWVQTSVRQLIDNNGK